MTNKSRKSINNLSSVGNYTKNAVENFEENIVTQTNFLDKVEQNHKISEKSNLQ